MATYEVSYRAIVEKLFHIEAKNAKEALEIFETIDVTNAPEWVHTDTIKVFEPKATKLRPNQSSEVSNG